MVLARATLREHRAALRYLRTRHSCWSPTAIAISAQTGMGITDLWDLICAHQEAMHSSGTHTLLRQDQQSHWMWDIIFQQLHDQFLHHDKVRSSLHQIEESVRTGSLSARAGAQQLLSLFSSQE